MARMHISACVMLSVLQRLDNYADSGTLIFWPWGVGSAGEDDGPPPLHRDELGHIRIVPRLAGIPCDGKEAIELTCTR